MEPILVSIAAAIAAKGAGGLYDLVKQRFGREPEALKALEAAESNPRDPVAVKVLAERLELAQADDAAFADQLRTEWRNSAPDRRVVNQISGSVTGKVVQAGEIHGNITF